MTPVFFVVNRRDFQLGDSLNKASIRYLGVLGSFYSNLQTVERNLSLETRWGPPCGAGHAGADGCTTFSCPCMLPGCSIVLPPPLNKQFMSSPPPTGHCVSLFDTSKLHDCTQIGQNPSPPLPLPFLTPGHWVSGLRSGRSLGFPQSLSKCYLPSAECPCEASPLPVKASLTGRLGIPSGFSGRRVRHVIYTL